jgi:hypothetical protein
VNSSINSWMHYPHGSSPRGTDGSIHQLATSTSRKGIRREVPFRNNAFHTFLLFSSTKSHSIITPFDIEKIHARTSLLGFLVTFSVFLSSSTVDASARQRLLLLLSNAKVYYFERFLGCHKRDLPCIETTFCECNRSPFVSTRADEEGMRVMGWR